MAQHQSHISFSAALGIAYAAGGVYALNVLPEHAILALALVVITGILPDIDGGEGAPAQELGALLAMIAPVALVESFPQLRAGGVARIALVVIGSYLLTRVLVVRGLQKFTVHRGMLHSLPAAIILFEVVYLVFWDMFWHDKLYIAGAAFVGYFSHLLLDATSNVDLVGRALGKSEKKEPVLKLAGGGWGTTLAFYGSAAVLAWYIVQDFYPHIRFYAGVKY